MNFARLDLKFSSKLGNLFYLVPTKNYSMVGKVGQLIIRTREGVEKFNDSGANAGVSVVDHTLNDYLKYPDGSILEPGETVKAYKIDPDLSGQVEADPNNKKVARYWYGFVSDPGAEDSWGIQGYWEIWPDSFPVPNSHNASVNSVQIGGAVKVGVFFPGTQGIEGPPGETITLDETPIQGSENPVKGGGVYEAIQSAVAVDVGDEINNSQAESSLEDTAKIALYLDGLKHITGLNLKSLFLPSTGDAILVGSLSHDGSESSKYLFKTTDYTILSSDRKTVLFNPPSPGKVLTLVINPEDGDERTIICPYNAANTFTLEGDGELIEGQTSLIVSPGETLNLKYFTGIGWLFFA